MDNSNNDNNNKNREAKNTSKAPEAFEELCFVPIFPAPLDRAAMEQRHCLEVSLISWSVGVRPAQKKSNK